MALLNPEDRGAGTSHRVTHSLTPCVSQATPVAPSLWASVGSLMLLLLQGFSPKQIHTMVFIAPLSRRSLFWADAQAPEQHRLFSPSAGLFSELPFSARAQEWFPATRHFLGLGKLGKGEKRDHANEFRRFKVKPASAAKLPLTHLSGIHLESWKDCLQDSL